MPIWDRDWYRNWYFGGKHPPACTCVRCTEERLNRLRESQGRSSKSNQFRTSRSNISTWLLAFLIVCALSLLGFGISILLGTSVPLWLSVGFSLIFVIEKWFKNVVRNKVISRLYRLALNLSMLSLFGYLVWSGIKLFSHKVVYSPLIGSLLFIFGIVLFIYVWRIVAKNSWRWPSLKLTLLCLVCLFLVFSFAGVQPLADYKDEAIDFIVGIIDDWQEQEEEVVLDDGETELPKEEEFPEDEEVESPEIINLHNPSWLELQIFLQEDKTDQLDYIYPTFTCGDFASTLQNNAKEAGLRCAYVGVMIQGYPDPFNYGIPASSLHALNAFETTDRGLVYIDCTGLPPGYYGPENCDTEVDITIGGEYIPRAIFPSWQGWMWESMGTIVDVYVIRW